MARGKCPRGVLCMSSTLAFVIVLCILLAFYSIKVKYKQPKQQQHQPQPQQQPQQQQIQQVYSGDSRYSMAPEPLRVFQPTYTPINIPTRGIPESFQSIGIINIDDKTLPLYGRRINNDRWNYYTRTDTYNPVPIPIRFQKRDCMDDIGCKEIMSGDEAHVMNKFGKTTIYNYNGPKYIPGFI